MISYEIALGVAIIGVIMVYGTMDLAEVVRGADDWRLDPFLGHPSPARGLRYDQLMKLGWRGLFPSSVVNAVVTAVVLIFLGETL